METGATAAQQASSAAKSRFAAVQETVRALLAGTPGILRIAGAVGVIVTLLFAVLGSSSVAKREDALKDASMHAEQLVLLQSLRTALVEADSTATNSFLIGGLGNAEDRTTYEANISEAASLITQGASAGAQDEAALSKVNDGLTRYTGLIEAARSNNRQGFPVGVAFLKQASALLHNEVLPELQDLSDTNQTRVDDAYATSGSAATTLLVMLGLTIGVLIAVSFMLAVKTRRFVNISIAAALVGMLVVGVVSASTMLFAQVKANNVATGPYRTTMNLAQARIDAYDAKSAESLTLISRGSGQAYETSFVELSSKAVYRLNALSNGSDRYPPLQDFSTYFDVHTKVRELDDAGNWDDAVKLSTTHANGAFSVFTASSAKALDAAWADTEDGLSSAQAPLRVSRALVVLAGLFAAILVWRGVAARVREYR